MANTATAAPEKTTAAKGTAQVAAAAASAGTAATATPNGTKVVPAGAKVPKPTAAPAKPAKATALKTPVNVYMLLMRGSDFVAHAEGCKQYKALKARSEYASIKEDYVIEGVLNHREIIMEAWDDQLRESWDPEKDGDDYTSASWAWLVRNGYVGATKLHSCLEGLPQTSKAAGTSKASSEAIKKATKTELATRVALAAAVLLDEIFTVPDPATTPIDPNTGALEGDTHAEFRAALLATFGSEESARQCVAQWMHGMPVDRIRWYQSGLPIPQRSDWADFQPPAEEDKAAKSAEPAKAPAKAAR